MVSRPLVALASRIACRKEPLPLSALFETVNVAPATFSVVRTIRAPSGTNLLPGNLIHRNEVMRSQIQLLGDQLPAYSIRLAQQEPNHRTALPNRASDKVRQILELGFIFRIPTLPWSR